MTEKRPIASLHGWFDQLREEGLKEESENKGYVWTIRIQGTSSLAVMGLASCDYEIDLNCSHVGETVHGIYRGYLAMKFKGDISGAKTLFALMGLRSQEDVEGWFRNDDFVMKLRPYDKEDEDSFIHTFRPDEKETPANPTEALANNFLNALLGGIKSQSQSAEVKTVSQKEPTGLWYDWDFHMTSGDMGTYFKLNGGNGIFFAKGQGGADEQMKTSAGNVKVTTIFGKTFTERYEDPIDSPFPYTVKVYPDGSVLFTLYNYNGSPLTVEWTGTIDRIPVEETIVVR